MINYNRRPIVRATPQSSRCGVAPASAPRDLFRTRLLLAIGCWACLGIAPAKAVDAPRLRQLIRRAQVVGVGRITAIEDLDFGRLRVYELLIEKELKPGKTEEPSKIRVVSLTDEPGAASAKLDGVGVAFVQPLRRNSYFDRHLADPIGLYEFTEKRDGWLEAAETRDLAAIATPIETLVGQSRKPAKDAKTKGVHRRALVFALLSAPHPLLVDDGIASLSTVPGLAGSLTETEAGIITSALHTTSLPMSARKKLIAEIAALKLKELVGALQDIREPALQEATWTALRKMGVPVSEQALRERLADEAPETRLAAARELLARDPKSFIPLVASTALRDRNQEVRLGAIEALGDTESADAVAPLETVFAGTDDTERQASARALRKIGGDAAVNALHRLAFAGSIDSQRYAVLVLLSLEVERDDPRVRDIAARHKDEKVAEMLDGHGFELGHSH